MARLTNFSNVRASLADAEVSFSTDSHNPDFRDSAARLPDVDITGAEAQIAAEVKGKLAAHLSGQTGEEVTAADVRLL